MANEIIPIAEVRTMAKSVAMSGMFGLKNENQAFTLMLIAQAEGIAPIQAIQKYSVINGLPSLKSTEIQARFQKSGGKIKWIETTNKKAICELSHPDYDGKYLSEFGVEDAKLENLLSKDNYKRMPKAMFMARSMSRGVRAVAPDCLNNMYSVEELTDTEPKEDIEDIETTETINNDVEADKLQLKMQLQKLNFNTAMMKEFYPIYITSDEILNKVVNDENELMKLVEQYESNEIIIEEE